MKNRTIPGFDPKSLTINGKTYEIAGGQKTVKRRLLLSLTRPPSRPTNAEDVENEWQFICDRARSLRTTFAYRFPHAVPFRETSQIFSDYSEWVYTLPDAQEPHIAWARAARDCGLIDSFSVDYGT